MFRHLFYALFIVLNLCVVSTSVLASRWQRQAKICPWAFSPTHAEFDACRYAQLRAGIRHNLAKNDDNDRVEEKTQLTAGLGLNFSGFRIDIGGLNSKTDVRTTMELSVIF